MLLCAKFIANAANYRPVSLGAHIRLDNKKFPDRTNTAHNLKHYSIRSHLKNFDEISMKKIERTTAKKSLKFKLAIRKAGKILLLRLLNVLPLSCRDKILMRIYKKLVSQERMKLNYK